LHAYSSVTWSHEITWNLHAHSSVTWSHDIMDDRHAWSTRRESITWNTIANQAQSVIYWVIDIFYI
jgi:hypothetical protein